VSLYPARAKTVESGKITLSDGDVVYAIGNREFFAGDMVWTDGKFAYGFQGRGGGMVWNEKEEWIPIFATGLTLNNVVALNVKTLETKIGNYRVEPYYNIHSQGMNQTYRLMTNNGKDFLFCAPVYPNDYDFRYWDAYMDEDGYTAVFTDAETYYIPETPEKNNIIKVYDIQGTEINSCYLPDNHESKEIDYVRISSGRLSYVQYTSDGRNRWMTANFDIKSCQVTDLRQSNDYFYPIQDGLWADFRGGLYDKDKKQILKLTNGRFVKAALQLKEKQWLLLDSSLDIGFGFLYLWTDGKLEPVRYTDGEGKGGLISCNNAELHKLKNIKKFLYGGDTQ